MRFQALILYVIPVVLFALAIVFQKPLKKYAAVRPTRLLILGIVFYLGGMRLLLLVLPFYSVYFFFREYKAGQAVADTASSRISSAAQGYVEVLGQGLVSESLSAPISRTPCLWYHFEKYKTRGIFSRLKLDRDQWVLIDSGTSDQVFAMSDGSAKCYVDPEGAQLSEVDYEEWFEGDYWHKEILLLPNKNLYVLGNFVTQSAAETKAQFNKEVSALMAAWKKDSFNFKKRFDLDGDGEVSDKELELVRIAAIREVQSRSKLNLEPRSIISKPADGRPFIISHHSHHTLIKRHKRHSLFYLALFVLSIVLALKIALPMMGVKPAEDTYPKGWAALDLDKYRLSCVDLTGTYSVKSDAGTIKLSDTFIGQRLSAPGTSATAQFFRDWDTITFSNRELNRETTPGAQKYSISKLVLSLQRSPQTMRAFENQLKNEAPDLYARYQGMTSPETRRSAKYEVSNDSYIEPAKMSDVKFANSIDDHFLWHTHEYELEKYSADLDCKNGWLVTGRKAENNAQHRWVYVAVTKDKAGNLVAKEYYQEPNNKSGVQFDDSVTVLGWTRWPAAAPAWSSHQPLAE